MYYSKIKVDKTPQTISKTIKKSLGYEGELTISILKELGIGDNDVFNIQENENTNEVFLIYTLKRLETVDEVSERVTKEVSYNKRYDDFHANRK